MFQARVKIKRVKEFDAALMKALPLAAKKAGIIAADGVRADMKAATSKRPRYQDPKTKKFVAGQPYERSNPGERPSWQTGTLARSIKSAVLYKAGGEIDDIVLRLGSEDVEYSTYLELGTSKMRARPFLRWAMPGMAKQFLESARGIMKAKGLL